MKAISLKAIPTFRIENYNVAIEFYVALLGFKIEWEHRPGPDQPVYMEMSRDSLVVHLSENPRFQSGSVIFVETVGIEEYYHELLSRKGKFFIPSIEKTPWGTKQMEITDPFGNLLRFNENITQA